MRRIFLSFAEVLEIHQDQIDRYGGEPGIRDRGLLQSAIATPAAGFGGRYLHEDLIAMASAYLFHIAKNHPFIDGNKRTGAVATLVFMLLNGIQIEINEDDLEKAVLAVAEGKWNKALVTDFLRKNSCSDRE